VTSSLALKQRDSFIMSHERLSHSRVSEFAYLLTYLLTYLVCRFIAATHVTSVLLEFS